MAGPQFGISILISEHLDKYNSVVSSIEYIQVSLILLNEKFLY